MAKKMSLKNKLALIGIPLLIVALAAAVYIAPKETSTETKASTGGKDCKTQCTEKYSGKKDLLDRCTKACTQTGQFDWKLRKGYRPLFCTAATANRDAANPPTTREKLKTWLAAVVTGLTEEGSDTAKKVLRRLDRYEPGDTQKAFDRYCTGTDQGEEGEE